VGRAGRRVPSSPDCPPSACRAPLPEANRRRRGRCFPTPLCRSRSSWTADGAWSDLRTDPETPPGGRFDAELRVLAPDGSGVDGLDVALVPWMPSMSQGSNRPVTTAEGSGRDVVRDVRVYMAGLWRLRVTLTDAFGQAAEVNFEVDVPSSRRCVPCACPRASRLCGVEGSAVRCGRRNLRGREARRDAVGLRGDRAAGLRRDRRLGCRRA
jgi:hypothetical protein